jgi:hypothetical protein
MTLVCEHCNASEKNVAGYDDDYFLNTVIPSIKCKSCGNAAKDTPIPLTPKYPEWKQL